MNTLKLEDAPATMRKISTNVLGKDAENTLFTLPLEGIELTREQLNAYLGDRTFEAWFDQRKDGSYHPMPFWQQRKDGSYPIDDVFKCDTVTLLLSGDKTIEFETVDADEDDDESEDVPAAKISQIKFTPTSGGITKLSLHMQVRPGLGKDNLALQEHQFRVVRVTLGDLTKVERKGVQGTLPLENGAGEKGAAAAETNGNGKPAGKDGDGFEDAARRQVEAFNSRNGKAVDGRSERVKHQDRQRGRGAH